MGKRSNIAAHLANPAFQFLQRDVTEADAHSTTSPSTSTASFILLRSRFRGTAKAIDTLRINYRGTETTLDFAVRNDSKCVLASTSDVYGRNPKLPFAETDESVIGSSKVARWSYAVSKLFDEHLAFAYQDSYGIPVTLLRFFGSYGPHQHLSWWGGPQSVFIEAALRDEEIPIHGDGMQTRSFTYVSDTVAGIYAAMMKDEANGEIFNIGSTHEISIVELARMIWRLVHGSGEAPIKFVPYESFTGKQYEDVRRRVPDVSSVRARPRRPSQGRSRGRSRTHHRVAARTSASS